MAYAVRTGGLPQVGYTHIALHCTLDADTGDIAAAVGLKDVTTGDTLCDINKQITLERMEFPEPVISVAVEPKTKADQEKMGIALGKLAQEDPSFRVHPDEESGQTIISGMGELPLDILVDRMKREFKVEANVGAPQVAYRETIRKSTEAEGKFVYALRLSGVLTGAEPSFASLCAECDECVDKCPQDLPIPQTLADLVSKTESEMLRTKNFGRKSLNELKELLEAMGLSFGMDIRGVVWSVIAVYGVFVTAIGWEYALWMWAYALAWFLVNDRVKLGAYRVFGGGRPLLARARTWVTTTHR